MSTEMFEINGINVANIKSDSQIAFFGIASLAGSNYESPQIAGISHYIEHCHFKGTKTRTWKQINSEFAKLGVSQNAYTSSIDVLYFATCPKENIGKVIDLMSDMFFNSTFPENEIEKERNVIIEEKKMYDDDPKQAFSSAVGEQFFTWSMGHETIGTNDTIKSINREQMIAYLNDKISLENMVFICSGDIDTKDLKKYLKKSIPASHPYLYQSGHGLNRVADNDKLWNLDVINRPDKIKYIMERENITQSSIQMMVNGIPTNDKYVHHAAIVREALAGGFYSLLFEKIREELGLCYAIGMSDVFMSYPEHKVLALYSYLSPNNVDLFIEECEKVLKKVIKNGIDKNLFECAKTDYLASTLRATETSAGKAFFLSKKLLYYKEGNLEDVLKKIRSVKIKDCNSIVERLLDVPYNWAVMNPKK